MTLNKQPLMDVVRREDKEERLKTFIAQYFQAGVDAAGSKTWSLVARSPESPVVLALASYASQLQAAGISVQVIMSELSPPNSQDMTPRFPGFATDLRLARNPRLLDAHEQLNLSATTSWVGDCMRREPAKRDAYECYAHDCPTTARWTRLAFQRLWLASELVTQHHQAAAPQRVTAPEAAVAAALALNAADAEKQPTASGSTRH